MTGSFADRFHALVMPPSSSLLRQTVSLFRRGGVPEPETSANLLFAHVLGRSKGASGAGELSAEQRKIFDDLVKRRAGHEPLQYLLGEWDFRHLQGIKTRAPVLIPRPETEELAALVEGEILARKQRQGLRQQQACLHLLDVGAGTGCIGLSILTSRTVQQEAAKDLRVTAVDVLPEAVALITENANHFLQSSASLSSSSGGRKTRDDFNVLLADALTLFSPSLPSASSAFSPGIDAVDILISNPPYIDAEDYDKLLHPQVKGHESPLALLGQAPLGLGFTLRLLRSIASPYVLIHESVSPAPPRFKLRPGASLFFELDSFHPALLADILEAPHEKRAALKTASGFAPPSSLKKLPTLSKEEALEEDWLARFSTANVDLNKLRERAGREWEEAVRDHRGVFRECFKFREAFLDLQGRPRFVHLGFNPKGNLPQGWLLR